MKVKVISDQITLPISNSSSSPLGLPRKRPGSSTSPLTNPKRKQVQKFARLYSYDVYGDQEEVPLINIPLGTFIYLSSIYLSIYLSASGTNSLSPDEIEDQIKQEIDVLASILKLTHDIVECILYQCSWNKDLVIQVRETSFTNYQDDSHCCRDFLLIRRLYYRSVVSMHQLIQ